MNRILSILIFLIMATVSFSQVYDNYLVDASGNPIEISGSTVVFNLSSGPEGITVNEVIGRGFTAGDITTNNGTADNLWSEDVYDDLQAAGVDNVRIVFWYANDSGSDPWPITPSTLTNLAIIVDKLNAHGIIAIIDYHQPMFKRDNLYTQANIDRWVSHWGQIANHFSSYDSTDVVYEPLNEPEYDALSQMSLSDWNTMQQDVIDEIRLYDLEKSIFITPYQWSKLEYLEDMVVPTDPSNRLILSIHYYDPKWRSEITTWPNIWPLWYNLEYQFAVLEAWMAANPNIDVTIGEWGSKLTTPTPARQDYTRMLANFFAYKGWSASWWDLKAWEFEAYLDGSGWITAMRDAILTDVLPAFEAYDSTQLYVSDFSSTIDGWSTWTELGGAVNLSVSGDELVINITNGSTGGTNSVRVRTPALTVTNGKLYRISYEVRGTYPFLADHLNAAHNWWNIDELSGGGTFTRVFTYEQTEATVASNYVQFYVGGSTGTIYISNMRIEEIVYPAVVADDIFEDIWSQDFESSAIEDPYTYAHVQEDFPWETNWTDGRSRSSYVSGSGYTDNVAIESVDGSRVMTNRYGADAWGVGTEGGNLTEGTGLNMVSVFEAANGIEEIWLIYNIKYSSGFDWGLGGKMPGIAAYPFTFNSGAPPLEDEGGFYIMMWQPDGGAKFYDYWHDETPPDYQYGQGPQLGTGTLQDDVWYSVAQRFVMSDVGSYNSIHEIFIDGILVDDFNGQLGRNYSFIGFNSLEFASFQGGGDNSYATAGAHESYYDDIRLAIPAGEATAEHPQGNTASPANRDISAYITQK